MLTREQLKEQLISEEKRKWVTFGPDRIGEVEKLFAEDFLEVDVSGRGIVNRQQIIQELRKGDLDIHKAALEDIHAVYADDHTVVLVYKVSMQFSMGGREWPPMTAYASSVWVDRNGKWVTVYYQATPASAAG